MTLEELIAGLAGLAGPECSAEADPDFDAAGVEVTGVHSDSRSVEPGGLFVAIAGEVADGNDYISSAVEKGARSVVVEQGHETACKDVLANSALLDSVTVVVVPDVREALSVLASRFYGVPSESLTLVGITGTNGKTTVAYIVESILKEAGYSTGVIGTINCRYAGKTVTATHTTPGPVELHRVLREMVDAGVTHCVMEVSSHALEQKRVHSCRFSATVFTNLTHEHLDYHKNMEEYFQAKSLLFSLLKEGAPETGKGNGNGAKRRSVTDPIINIDDSWGRRLYGELPFSLTYGLDSEAQMRPVEHVLESDSIKAVVETPRGAIKIESALIGEYNLYNILASLSVAYSLGVGCDAIERGITALKKIPGRLEPVPVPGASFRAYVDYAHTADALERVLGELERITVGRLITVFGCGGDRDHEKRPEMARAASRHSTVSIVTSDNPRDESPGAIIEEVVAGMAGIEGLERVHPGEGGVGDEAVAGKGKCFMVIEERREAIRRAVAIAGASDTVLVAGKGHEDYQIVRGVKHHFDDIEELRAAVTELTV
ncbi:MAG: UDP-N-acetylmuramoyl-L-alanyl-D-glutamate--2,6-diaminopimelate ligase [Proteobacteria bacterium]|nr:UDP-N-acetylmuramoyl-L-alanyl-D-glutamate--2,6-diaminopimelate ligase [Pseudomonadota bacterium]